MNTMIILIALAFEAVAYNNGDVGGKICCFVANFGSWLSSKFHTFKEVDVDDVTNSSRC